MMRHKEACTRRSLCRRRDDRQKPSSLSFFLSSHLSHTHANGDAPPLPTKFQRISFFVGFLLRPPSFVCPRFASTLFFCPADRSAMVINRWEAKVSKWTRYYHMCVWEREGAHTWCLIIKIMRMWEQKWKWERDLLVRCLGGKLQLFCIFSSS